MTALPALGAILDSRAGCGSKTWADDARLYPESQARFGDETWDLADLPRSPNRSPGCFRVRFAVFPAPWRLLAREYLMALVDVQPLRDNGVIRRRSVKARTLITEAERLLRLATWATENDLGLPSTWDSQVPTRYLRELPTSSVRGLGAQGTILRRFHWHRAVLTDGGLDADPWPGVSSGRLPAHLRRADMPVMADGCLTPILQPEDFFALLGAALAYITDFSADIFAASDTFLPRHRGPGPERGQAAVTKLRSWASAPESIVPMVKGRPLYSRVAALSGIQPTAFAPSRRTSAALLEIVDGMVAEGRVIDGGFYAPRFEVTRPDGTRGPWRGPMERQAARQEMRVLRSAAYLVLIALTGMRDSEGQDTRKGSLHERLGTRALTTRRHKHAQGEEMYQWVSDDVAAAYQLLEQLSGHPTHIVASLMNMHGRLNAGMNANHQLKSFVAHVNANRSTNGLPLIADTDVHCQRLRHTFAYVAGLFEGGDLVVGDRFGHAFATTTAAYQKHSPDDEWLRWKREGNVDGSLRRWIALADLLDKGGAASGRDAEEVQATARQLKALVITNPQAARRLADANVDRWRPGKLLDCNYDHGKPDAALCRRAATALGLGPVPDGPLPDLCPTLGCVNATVTPIHAPAIRDAIDAARSRMAGATSTVAAAQAQTEADGLTALLARIEPGEEP